MNSDPTFQLLARASGYLEAARIVVNNGGNNSALRAPVAHLIAHALEVLMKHVLLGNGKKLDDIRKKYGHSLAGLWSTKEMQGLRDLVFLHARSAWEKAKSSGHFRDDFRQDPEALKSEYICELGRLHSSETDYALRYVARSDETVPVPLFLLDTFQPVKDEFARKYSPPA